LGIALGVTFGVCFVTGLLSHFIQQPPAWFTWPARPAGLYRLTQGTHVVTGLASIPLLLVKLWVVYPHFWAWPPFRSIATVVERASLVVLVGGSLFLLLSGLQNIAGWYPWGFFFPPAHYWAAWATIGGLVAHIGAKAHLVSHAIRNREPSQDPADEGRGGLSRRALLGLAGSATGLIVATTVGQTLAPLRRIALLAPRSPAVGPAGFPVNRTAAQARVIETAQDPSWMLAVEGKVARPLKLTLADLRSMTQEQRALPIACVEGWSATVNWGGIALRSLLDAAGASPEAEVRVKSLEQGGLYRSALLDPGHARDPATLLALDAEGAPLTIDHGYPLRLIAPSNPGVMQTKWVARVVVL
jgi:DMSO/TMAO reductase YedYZ molybdopterin-dependent catalytic subunit